MKLNEYFSNREANDHSSLGNMNGLLLEMVKEKSILNPMKMREDSMKERAMIKEIWHEIVECDEFSDADEVHFVDNLFMVEDSGMVVEPISIKVVEGTRFLGKTYVKDVLWNYSNYDPDMIRKPVCKGACITPVTYNNQTFEPERRIVMSFSPEVMQDNMGDEKVEDNLRKRLHETLDEILDFPEAFTHKPRGYVVVRGFFEKVESVLHERTSKVVHQGIDFTKIPEPLSERASYVLHFCMANRIEGGMASLKLEKHYIPFELEDAFRREVIDENQMAQAEHVNAFLEAHGRSDIVEMNSRLIGKNND